MALKTPPALGYQSGVFERGPDVPVSSKLLFRQEQKSKVANGHHGFRKKR